MTATLRKDGQTSTITGASVDAAHESIALDVPNLADGKYTAFVVAKDLAGQTTQNLRLVFWVEADPFDWHDSVIYMGMTDRFKNGDTSNDPAPTPNVDPREDYHGGDLAGVTSDRQRRARSTRSARASSGSRLSTRTPPTRGRRPTGCTS